MTTTTCGSEPAGRPRLFSLSLLIFAFFFARLQIEKFEAHVVLCRTPFPSHWLHVAPPLVAYRIVLSRRKKRRRQRGTSQNLDNSNDHRAVGVGTHHATFRVRPVANVQEAAETYSGGGGCCCCNCRCCCCEAVGCSCSCNCCEAFVRSAGLLQKGALPRERLPVSQGDQRSYSSTHGF